MNIPFYLKTDDALPWSGNDVFHLMSRDGLFLCRENRFFRATTPARNWPEDLQGHAPSIKLRFPKIPRLLVEKAVGFFDRVGRKYGAEAMMLLTWGEEVGYELVVPPQVTEVDVRPGLSPLPIKLDYEMPTLPLGRLLIGDIHSHVNLPAYTSKMDQDDAEHSPGLHMVVGRLFAPGEPPDFEIVVTVDGHSFCIEQHDTIIEGYKQRRLDVPVEWLEQVRVLEVPENVIYPIVSPANGTPPNGDESTREKGGAVV